MEHTQPNSSTQRTTDAFSDVYLPCMPRLSTEPGAVERFVTNLFRRRGGLRVVVRPRTR